MNSLQRAETEILKNVAAYMEENGYRYVALGGTLLGAVRHKGFIPWDDDIDIGLPREDYDRFLEQARKTFDGKNSPYELQNAAFTDGYIYYFSRVIDRSVRLTDRSATVEKEQFAWIDIFPLDGMPGGVKGKIHKFRLLKARMEYQYARFDELVNVNLRHRPWHERLLIGAGKAFRLQKVFRTDKTFRKLDKLLKKYPYASSPYAVNFMGAGKFREMHEKSVYDARATYPFEDMTIKSVKDYDKWLTQMYGDYMTPPAEEDRNKHCTEGEEKND